MQEKKEDVLGFRNCNVHIERISYKSLDCSILFANKNKNFKDKKDMPVVKLKFLIIKVLI